MKHKQKQNKDWKEEFDLRFSKIMHLDCGFPQNCTVSKDIKSFISSLLSELAENMEGEVREDIVSKIRKSRMWKLVPDTPRMIMCSDKELDELLQTLTNK